MRLKISLLIISLVLIFSATCYAETQFKFDISIGDDGVKSFNISFGEYYQVPEKQIIIIKKKNIPDDEIPVVLFIAKRAKIDPQIIIKLHLDGSSWMSIALKYGLTADCFYVPVKDADYGPPYGKAYGHYKKHHKKKWKKIKLADDDIINLVNLKFISGYYKCSPETIIKMRSEGKSFIEINDTLKKQKQSKKVQAENTNNNTGNSNSAEKSKDFNGKNKGKGKWKNKGKK